VREDVFGYLIALQMLLKSLKPGAWGWDYQQFMTICRLRSAYTGVYQVFMTGMMESTVLGSRASQTQLMNSPTESLWFRSFVKGCEKQMGKESDANVAISSKALRECLREIMMMVEDKEDKDEKKQLLCLGSFVVITYVALLRGYKMFYMDLTGLRRYLSQGMNHPKHGHVVIPLLGRFKGETSEKWHLIPLPLVTNLGIQVRSGWISWFPSKCCKGGFEDPSFAMPGGKSNTRVPWMLCSFRWWREFRPRDWNCSSQVRGSLTQFGSVGCCEKA
jgi:hypothetical protein